MKRAFFTLCMIAFAAVAAAQSSYVESVIDMRMVWVDGGTFMMGAAVEQNDAHYNEKPAHQVAVDGYWIAATEVTQAQWKAVMGSNPSTFKGEDNPVDNVSWRDAQTFCEKLSRMTGKRYALPTEAQWEYAARGGNKSKGTKYSGSSKADMVAWHDGNSDNTSHPVAQKRPNELGLYDMSGNLYEWCCDRYAPYTSAPQTNPTGAASGDYYTLRGGSWHYAEQTCRITDRINDLPQCVNDYYGLRIVCLP